MPGKLGLDDKVKVTDDLGTTLGVVSDPLRTDPTGVTTQPVSAASLPLPSGASTAANQTTINSTLANVIKNEDAGHVSGHAGIMALSVRNTGNATLTSATLDYSPIAVNAEGSVRVVGDRARGTADNSSNPVKVGGRHDTTLPNLTNGQRGTLQLTNRGALITSERNINTTKAQVKAANDVVNAFTWLDFGTKDERVNTITWTSATIGLTVTDTYAYTLVSNKYRLDSITTAVA